MFVILTALAFLVVLLPQIPPKHPTIIVIQADDLNRRVYHNTQLPALLEPRGVVFERHYATQALCCPSRATFLRGQYSHNTGVTDNDGRPFAAIHHDTLATRLQDAGWTTAILGKYLNLVDDPAPGWTIFEGTGSARVPQARADYLRERVTDLLTEPQYAPLFLYINPGEPHTNVEIAERYRNAPVPEGCESECKRMTRRTYAVVDLVQTVLALRPDATIIFTSDNGYLLGEHGETGKSKPWDASARVPTVVVHPGATPTRISALTANTDWVPTILDLANLPIPAYVDGRSLAPYLRNTTPVTERSRLYLGNRHQVDAIVTANRLFVQWPDYRELWDAPLERRLITDENLRSYRDALAALTDCAAESCRANE